MSIRSWARKLFTRPDRRQPTRKPTRLAPSLELLEDRLTPADLVDIGGLRFLASDGFTLFDGSYSAVTGTVSIGYKPSANNEPFLPLLRADLQNVTGTFDILDQPGNPSFTVTSAQMSVVVGGSPSVPIPIWQKMDDPLTVDINQLIGNNGFSIPSDITPVSFEVANVDFTLSSLTFNNPDGGDTSDAQVKMQGGASFDKIPIVQDLGVKVNVDGTNYVIADTAGVELTGLDVNIPVPASASIAGMELTGSIKVTYTHDSNSFAIGGEVSLTSQDQPSGNVHLNNVGAGLDLTFADGALTDLGFKVSGSFEVVGLTVSTPQDQSLSFNWNKAESQYEIGGAIQFQFNDSTVLANFGSGGAPAIVVKDGQLQSLQGYIAGDIVLSKASVSSQGITVNYDRDNSLFEMSGDLTVKVPTGDTTQMIAARMFDSTGGPGLVIQNGQLQKLSLALSGGFSVYGLGLEVDQAGVEWQKDPDTGENTLLIGGSFEVDFKAFQTTVTLRSGDNPGLKIADGMFDLESFKVEIKGAQLGPVTLEDLTVSYAKDQDSFDLGVTVWATMPGGWSAQGEFDLVEGKLDTISLDMSPPAGQLEIGDTGLSIIDIHAKVTNIETPSQIIVTGGIAVVWGEQFSLLGHDVYAFRVEGDFTADANEFILDATAQLGAYSDDNGITWQGAAGQGNADLSLNWGDSIYSLHVEVDGLFTIFDLTGDFTFAAGKDIKFLAEVDVVVPNFVPFIGGDKLGGFGFFFDHTLQDPVSTTVAAWIELDIIWDVEVGFEIVYDADNPNGKPSLIGAGTIDGFKQEVQPPVDQTFTYTTDLKGLVPANATSATLHADWSRPAAGIALVGRPTFRVQHTLPNGTTVTYTEDQFADHGIAIITDPIFNTPTTKAIQIVGSVTNQYAALQGDYKLLIDVIAEGGNPFPNYGKQGTFPDALKVQAAYHIPKPIFGTKDASQPYVPVVPGTPIRTFPVTLQGNMDDAFLRSGQARVSLYRVLVQDPDQSPILVGSVAPGQFSGNGVNWQAQIDVPIDDLAPLDYVIYAVANDGFNVPVKTALSSAFTPTFAVQGSVANQNADAMTGWSVYLDFDQDGVRDTGPDLTEPTAVTNVNGAYAFASTDVPAAWINKPFDVRLSVPSDQFIPFRNPITITYDGRDTKVVDFAVNEKTAIKGIVFEDQGGDGNPGDGTPLGGATVYLDTNGNGVRDAGEPSQLTGTDGSYAFRNLQVGSYTVGLDVNPVAPAASYVVPAGTAGNQSQNQALGMAFIVSNPIDVTSLGVFDSGGDGFKGTLTATLYDRVTQKAVATLSFTPSDPGTLAGGTRFKELAEPVTLYAGFQGLIVAEGFSTQDPWASNGTSPAWTVNGGSNDLTFTGTGVTGPAGQYPTTVGLNSVANPYAAGSFLFRDPIRVQSSPAGSTYSVTLDDSGFDVKSSNNFGVQPFSTLSGTVTTQHRTSEELDPATPDADVTVQLVRNGIVVGSTTTGNDGSYSFTGVRPGAYQIVQGVPAGYRQITPFNGNFKLQDPTGADAWSLPNGLQPVSAVTADFDGNGQPDVAVVAANPNGDSSANDVNVFVYYNGNFSQPVSLRGGANGVPVKAVAVDVTNGTGLPDLVILYQNGQVSVLPNQARSLGNGAVQWTLPIDDQFQSYNDLATGLFNTAMPGSNQFAAMRWDLAKSQYSIVLFYPGGTVRVAATEAGDSPTMAAAYDPADGFTDLVAGIKDESPVLLASDGNGGFSPTTIDVLPTGNGITSVVAIGDINGDGLPDVASADSAPTDGFIKISYAIQDAQGEFSQGYTPGIGSGFAVYSMAIQDVNGDFRPDLVWVGSEGFARQVYVALNTGTPGDWFTTARQTTWPLAVQPGEAYDLVLGDLDGDEFPDLIVTDYTNGLVNFVTNSSTIPPPSPISLQLQPGQDPADLDFDYAQLPSPHVQDLGFEAPVVGSGSGAHLPNPNESFWTFSPSSGVSGNNSGYTSGASNAPQGNQVAYLQMKGSVSQKIYFEAGTYSLSFLAAQRANTQASFQTIQVLIDGVAVGPSGGFKPAGTSYNSYATDGFKVTAGYHTVSIVGLNPNGGDNTAFIDAVAIQLSPAVGDFGFETPAVGSQSNSSVYRPIDSPWTFTGSAGVSDNGSAITLLNSPAPQGSQVAFLQGTGSVSQKVYFKAGIYRLSFLAARRNLQQGGVQAVQVLIDGSPVGPAAGFKPGTSYGACSTDVFEVKAGYHTITFVGLNPNAGDDTVFIDGVSLQAAGSAATNPGGPTAPPVLDRYALLRDRRHGERSRVRGATLTFNVPVNLDPSALRLVRFRDGRPVEDLSEWIRIVMLVQNGQTQVRLRFRSPGSRYLPPGRYGLFIRHDLVRNTLTGDPLTGSDGGNRTIIRFST